MSASPKDGPPPSGEGRSSLLEQLADDIIDEALPDYRAILPPRRFAELRAILRAGMLSRPASRARLERMARRLN